MIKDGITINMSGFFSKAPIGSSLNKSNVADVSPHPGQCIPVIRWIRQGIVMSNPVINFMRIDIKK